MMKDIPIKLLEAVTKLLADEKQCISCGEFQCECSLIEDATTDDGDEETEKPLEPSGDSEKIIINPEIDAVPAMTSQGRAQSIRIKR